MDKQYQTYDQYTLESGFELLELMEVQWSSYLKEDDQEQLKSNLSYLKTTSDHIFLSQNETTTLDPTSSYIPRIYDPNISIIKEYSTYSNLLDLCHLFQEDLTEDKSDTYEMCLDIIDLMMEEWFKFKYNYNFDELELEMKQKGYGIFKPFPEE